VEHLERIGKAAWVARTAQDYCAPDHLGADVVVLANAAQANQLLRGVIDLARLPKLAGMHRLAGQVSYFSSALNRVRQPRLVVGGVGYWLPEVGHVNVGGSTYVPCSATAEVTPAGHQAIFSKLSGLLGAAEADLARGLHPGLESGWAGWRAVVQGRLPVIGPLEPEGGLWLACGYGSRGLTWSALAGDVLAAHLHQEPQVIERDLLKAIALR